MRNLIPHFIHTQYRQHHFEGQFHALTMFVDVSGFTQMTQALMREGHEGAEILASILNQIFERMMNAVYKRGGFISVFAGDAFTAVFPLNDAMLPDNAFALHVLACAERIQTIFRRHGTHATPYGTFRLRVKVGLSCGMVAWGIAGREDKAYFFRGEAIDGCAFSEHHAEQGDIIFDQAVAQILPLELIETTSLETGYYRRIKTPRKVLQNLPPLKLPRRPGLQKSIATRFLPDAVIAFKELGEFRPIVPIFISFEGISTIQELNDWAFVLITNIKQFSGYFNHLDFGDKGGVVICGVGAPVMYEDMVARALHFVLALKNDVKNFPSLANLKIRIGLTYGMVFAGIVGGQKRCEYTFYGEVVNLAARFMMKADWGEILVSEAIHSKTVQFNFEYQGDFSYKGIAEPVPTYTLLNRKSGIRHQLFQGEMIGRREELRQLHEFITPLFEHTFAGIIYIYGEAGIGKSRLAYAFKQDVKNYHTLDWCNCPADQILRKSFNPFITFLIRYFDQWSENTSAENKARFEKKYAALLEQYAQITDPIFPSGVVDEHIKELVRTKSVIGAQMGLFWYESLWEQLDAKGKYENTLYAMKNFILALSLLMPVVIEVEDGHWLDNDSLALLEFLIRNIENYPILLVSTLRYNDDGTKTTFALEGVKTLELDLNYLSPEDVKLCAEAELSGSINAELHALLMERTKGNPFYVQQIVLYFVENQIVVLQDNQWHLTTETLRLPDTINAVLIARIDRLSQQVRELVKVAAVIGREFDVLLLSAVLKHDVMYQVRVVEENQIWSELQELQYIFKHALIRDTAYQMQLRSRLRELHKLTALAMEQVYAENLHERYADLAFHYEKSEVADKAVEYLGKAGDQAKGRYQNQQALGFYNRLLSHIHDVEEFAKLEIDTLLKKGAILDLIGEWKECQTVGEEALRFSEEINDKRRIGYTKLSLGGIFRQTGLYDKAMAYFEQARDLFESAKDTTGSGTALRNLGRIAWQKSDHDVAMAYYEKALKIAEEVQDSLNIARNAGNIGILYTELKVDYDAAMTWYNKSLKIFEDLGEKLDISRVLNNIGECNRLQGRYTTAMTYYKQALTLHEELGNRLDIAITLGNVGHVYKAQKAIDTALVTYDRAIAILRELGNKHFLSECLIGKADALFELHRYAEAQVLNQEGLQIAQATERKEYILQGKVLSARIAFALGKEDDSFSRK